jgi:hypothetical protein
MISQCASPLVDAATTSGPVVHRAADSGRGIEPLEELSAGLDSVEILEGEIDVDLFDVDAFEPVADTQHRIERLTLEADPLVDLYLDFGANGRLRRSAPGCPDSPKAQHQQHEPQRCGKSCAIHGARSERAPRNVHAPPPDVAAHTPEASNAQIS